MGLGFAITIDVAKTVEDQLLKNGKVERGRLGVGIQEVSASLARSFGLERPQGALVSTVESGGAAGEAGLKAGEAIPSLEREPGPVGSGAPPLVAHAQPRTTARGRGGRGGAETAA